MIERSVTIRCVDRHARGTSDVRCHRAFTLVELLGATVLGALLTLAAMSVLVSAARSRAALQRAEATRGDWDATAAFVRRDLAAAERATFADGRITLWGYAALDRATLRPTHRPARVEYRVIAEGRRPWLVREQTLLDVSSNRAAWSEIVARGVSTIRIVPIVAKATSAPAPRPAPPAITRAAATQPATTRPTEPGADPFAAFGRPMPDAIELILRPSAEGVAGYDQVFRFR